MVDATKSCQICSTAFVPAPGPNKARQKFCSDPCRRWGVKIARGDCTLQQALQRRATVGMARVCGLCKMPIDASDLHIDEPRGVLCRLCKHNVDWYLRNKHLLIAYLETYE